MTCQPQVFHTDPAKDGSMPEIKQDRFAVDKFVGQGQSLEDVKDREKWQLLTRELA